MSRLDIVPVMASIGRLTSIAIIRVLAGGGVRAWRAGAPGAEAFASRTARATARPDPALGPSECAGVDGSRRTPDEHDRRRGAPSPPSARTRGHGPRPDANDDMAPNARRTSYVRRLRATVRPPLERGVSRRASRHTSREVCPWNVRFARALPDGSPYAPREVLSGRAARQLARELPRMTQGELGAAFKGSPMKRARLRGLERNAAVVLGNAGTADDVAVLTRALDDDEPLVREHAAWALDRLGRRGP